MLSPKDTSCIIAYLYRVAKIPDHARVAALPELLKPEEFLPKKL